MPAQVVNGVVTAIYSPSYSPDFVAPCLETMDTFPKFSEFYSDSHWDVIRDSFPRWVPETSVDGDLPVLARLVSNVVIDIS